MLTTAIDSDYSAVLVLNTPPSADCPAPESRGFFTSIVCLWPGSEQKYNTRKGNIAGRLTAVFKCLAVPLNKERIFNTAVRMPFMVTQSKVAKATSKTRSRSKSLSINPKVIANIVHLSYERREAFAKEKWHTALKVYMRSLNSREFDIAAHVLMFVSQKPCLVDPEYSCDVTLFPIGGKRNLRIAKKASQNG